MGLGTEASSTARPTFLLGAGAQKAGTTWLYRHLKRSPAFAAGYRKEYHVLDVVDVPGQGYMRSRVIDLAAEATDRLRRGEDADGQVLHRLAMVADPTFYLDYFTGLLSRPGVTLTADMTPENALVPAQRLRSVRDGFADRGVRTAALFLMRDPVERIWSQVRMQHHRTPERFSEPPERTLLRVHAEEQYAVRTRYDDIVQRLDDAFAADDVIYSFYERLFDADEVARICTSLGVSAPPPRLEQRANASPGGEDGLPVEIVATVATHYRGVYDFVAQRFDVDVERLWPASRYC